METEERIRFEVLLEHVLTQVKVIAEGHGSLVKGQARLEEGQRVLVERFDRLEIKVDVLDKKVDVLEGFAGDAQRRLKRIEAHLQLKPMRRSGPRPKAVRHAPPAARKKS